MHHDSTNGTSRGAALAELSTGLVQLYARHCGKGPTKAKTRVDGDAVLCILRDPYTVAERTLLDAGQEETVQKMREGMRQALEPECRRVVDETLGRRVVAHMSTMHVDPDLIVEIFVLESEDVRESEGTARSRTESPGLDSPPTPSA